MKTTVHITFEEGDNIDEEMTVLNNRWHYKIKLDEIFEQFRKLRKYGSDLIDKNGKVDIEKIENHFVEYFGDY